MPDKQVYEYAVIRYVPQVALEEFVNIGVILFVKKGRFLGVRYHLNEDRIRAFHPDVDMDELASYMQAWELICNDNAKDGGRIGSLDQASRFRWLTAVRSTVIQCSKVHPGLTDDPASLLATLFEKYVR